MPRRIVLSCTGYFALLSCLVLRAQTVPTSVSGNSTIAGHVVCADTNRPARLARVSLRPFPLPGRNNSSGTYGGGGGNGTTDFDGNFKITSVPAGDYFIDVTYNGYIDPFFAVIFPKPPFTDESIAEMKSKAPNVSVNGNDSANINLSLERGASIAGTVNYDDGASAPSIYLRVQNVDKNIRSMPSIPSQTDDQGRFRISGLHEGEYLVIAQMQFTYPTMIKVATSTGVRTQQTGMTTGIEIYAPGSLLKSAAKPISVKTSEALEGISIVIPTHGLHSVSGSVIQQGNGGPVASGSVVLKSNTDSDFTRESSILSDGSFHLDIVPEGTYAVSVPQADDTVLSRTAEGPFPQKHYRLYGVSDVPLTVGSSDVTGLVLQVTDHPPTKDPVKQQQP